MDEVCTTAFDGECEVYKRFGLDRVVVLRYVDGSGAPNSVEVNLSRFATADGAYAMFTKRVVADGDPAKATVKPLTAGGAGATSSSNAYVWRGQYLVELTFVTEDTKMTPAQMAQANERTTGAIAKDIGGKLPGSTDPLPSVALLPAASRVPLGVSYHPKNALSFQGIGPVAVGYYKEGDRRWRDVAIVRADADGAKEAFRAFKLKPGAIPVKGIGDEAVQVVIQEAADRAKAEYVVARKGTTVVAVGDEELVLDPQTPSDKQAPLEAHPRREAREARGAPQVEAARPPKSIVGQVAALPGEPRRRDEARGDRVVVPALASGRSSWDARWWRTMRAIITSRTHLPTRDAMHTSRCFASASRTNATRPRPGNEYSLRARPSTTTA